MSAEDGAGTSAPPKPADRFTEFRPLALALPITHVANNHFPAWHVARHVPPTKAGFLLEEKGVQHIAGVALRRGPVESAIAGTSGAIEDHSSSVRSDGYLGQTLGPVRSTRCGARAMLPPYSARHHLTRRSMVLSAPEPTSGWEAINVLSRELALA